ncbi:nicotinate-nucleotide--dimethylbenzimidazole phosphoribosyltransferase [Streptomyces sp. SDT5-1]|uniref:nicotinate-nucleotide--dimethylbenzimidazole phosphoribosyltransferase n=1 Tax=Streptomyces sp. SDT5-1 TaxID=3406418 RepID=UPI003FD126C2
MTDTGRVPGEGLPEDAGTAEQPGVPAPGAYTYLDQPEGAAEEDEILLMPGAQGAWGQPQHGMDHSQGQGQPYEQQHEQYAQAQAAQAAQAQAQAQAARRPLHMGPAVPETGTGPVRSLADRGPAQHTPPPARQSGPPTTGPEYLDIPPQGAAPWEPAQAQQTAETVAPQYAQPEAPAHAQEFAYAGQAPYAGHEQAAGGHEHPQQPLDAQYAEQSLGQADQTLGQFVPVDGIVPTTPHLAPTPPQAMVVPPLPEETAEQAGQQDFPEQQVADVPQGGVEEQGVPAQQEPVAVPEEAHTGQQAVAQEPVAEQPVAEQQVPEQPQAVVEDRSLAGQAPVEQSVPVEQPAPVQPAEVAPQAEPVQQDAAPVAPAPEAPAPEAPAQEAEPAPQPVAAQQPEVPQEPAPQQPEAEQQVVADEHVAPEQQPEAVQAPATQPVEPEPEAVDVHQDAATVPAPREGDSGAVLVIEDAEDEEPAEQTVAPAELTGEPEHLSPEAEAETAPEPAPQPEAAPEPEAAAEPTPAAPAYDDPEREAVLRVMRERRDIRNGFRSDPIPHEVLLRVLEAAHTAPSVGHSQPWDFVVIRSADTRRAMHELAMRQKDAYAKSLPKGRAKQFKELKIEAILDTPVNIVVTADPTRGGRHTLGRHTQPQMAPYSSALAVENLWLAARAEGLGVGWVSFFDEREMVRSLGLPEHLEVVAYLCVGYVDEFPEEPELMQAGWSKRRPLSWVVHEETYGRRALPGEDPHDLLAETVANIRPLDAKALGEAWERQKRMTKPAGALGMLEIIAAQLSGLSRVSPPPIPEPAAVAIFAGDHGVHAQGVTPWPQEVTGQMVANFLGGGAVCNAFANQVGAEVCVVDVGVAGELPATPGLLPRKVRAGTADMTTGPALTREEVKEAIEVGIETARDLVAAGNKALLTGEMGIANTTASAALISVYTEADPSEVTGRGTGINDETHARKVEIVRRALDVHQPDPADPIGVLAAVGGLEHAAMVGLLLGGASLRTPVILDGVSAGAAALVARAIAPEVLAACIAGHRSAEPGHVAALNKLGLRPLVDLDLRLGEGTGALLALPIVQSAARAMHEVATFDSAGVTEK